VSYPHRVVADPDGARRAMVEGVTRTRLAQIHKAAAAAAVAAAAAAGAAGEEEEEGTPETKRTDVLVDGRTGADFVVVPMGATTEHGGALLPLSTRKEFKKELRAGGGMKAAMKAAAGWAAAALNIGVTGAGAAGEASSDESGAPVAKKTQAAAAGGGGGGSDGHSHSHGRAVCVELRSTALGVSA